MMVLMLPVEVSNMIRLYINMILYKHQKRFTNKNISRLEKNSILYSLLIIIIK